MARDLKDEKDQTIAELGAQIEELKGQLADLAKTARRRGADLADDLQDQGEAAMDGLRRRGRRYYRAAADQADQLRSRAAGYVDDADTAVREHPATAMGIAVGLGFLLGLVLARR